MEPWLAALVIVFAVSAVITVAIQLSNRRPRPPVEASSGPAASGRGTLERVGNREIEYEQSLEELVSTGDALVVVDPRDSGAALVFGSSEIAHQLGEVVGAVPGELAKAAVGGNALLQAGVVAGEQSGLLVRLTKESTKAMRELKKIDAGDGAVMGVLRGDAGKFKHIVRFKPAGLVQNAANAGNVISAVAMQAQLAAIERAIADVAEDVREIQATLDITAMSKQDAVSRVLHEAYAVARDTGELSQAAWDQIAPMRLSVEEKLAYAERNLDHLLSNLERQDGTGDRVHWLEKNKGRLRTALWLVYESERTEMQFHALRLWWAASTADQSLPAYQENLGVLVEQLDQRRIARSKRVKRALKDAGETWWFDHMHSPIDSHRVSRRAAALRTDLKREGLMSAARDSQISALSQALVQGRGVSSEAVLPPPMNDVDGE